MAAAAPPPPFSMYFSESPGRRHYNRYVLPCCQRFLIVLDDHVLGQELGRPAGHRGGRSAARSPGRGKEKRPASLCSTL